MAGSGLASHSPCPAAGEPVHYLLDLPLDLPLDRFEPVAEAVVRAGRSASSGRFPDLYSPEQFPDLKKRP